MATIKYTNTWNKKPASYDPDVQGSWAVGFKLAMDGWIDEDHRVSLAFGRLSTPQLSIGAAEADFALIVANHPQIADRLTMYKVPCIYSTNEGWIEVQFNITDTLRQDAEYVAAQNFRVATDNYKTRHGMASYYL